MVFELTPTANGGWTESVLYSFTGGADGGQSWSGVTFDAAGNLYGTTGWAATYGRGVVFELTPNPDGLVRECAPHLHGRIGRSNSDAGLIFDKAGNLYGVTWPGGTMAGASSSSCPEL